MRGPILLSTAAAVAVSVVAVSGCSASSSHQTASTAASSTTTSPAATTTTAAASSPAATTSATSATPTKVSAAGKQFLVAIAPVNHDLASFLTLPNASSVATVTAAASKTASGETSLVRTLKHDTWPAASRTAFTALETAITKESPVYRACAGDHSVTAIKATLLKGKPLITARAAAAAKVRTALGLPAS